MVQRNNTIAADGSSMILPLSSEHGTSGRVQIIRTLSKAGIPQRIPTIYRTDAKLINPPTPGPRLTPTGDETHGYISQPLPTFYQLPTIEQSDPEIAMEHSSSSLPLVSPAVMTEESTRHSRRPKIQVVIPQHPVKNPEFVTGDIRKPRASKRSQPVEQEPLSAHTLEPVTAMTTQSIDMDGGRGSMDTAHTALTHPEEEKEVVVSEEDKAAAAHQRSISTGTDSSEQTQDSYVTTSSTSRHSAASDSSVSSAMASPEKQGDMPSKQKTRIDGMKDHGESTSAEQSFKTHRHQRSFEETKNKPLPPEPSRTVAPLLLRKKPSRENLASSSRNPSSPSRLISKFSSRELNNLDREFERSAPRPVLRPGQTRLHLVQAARDLENQLSTIPDPKDGSARSVASDERTLVASYHERSSMKLDMESEVVRSPIAEESKESRLPAQPTAIGGESFLCDGNDGCPLCTESNEAATGVDQVAPEVQEAQEASETEIVSAIQYVHETPTSPELDMIAPDDAAMLLLHIMESLDDLTDLFAAACVNRGFYLTFRKHELRLYQNVIYNMSPAAWERRDVSPPWENPLDFDFDGPVPEYTASSYLQAYSHDLFTITDLKALILARCESFLRLETVTGLSGMNPRRARELDNAFWRIWSFCCIFGCKKDREYDLVAQMDWLNGGPLAKSSRSPRLRPRSIASENFAHAAESALFSPSKSFGVGNGQEGLSAAELYDMIEIWNCLGVLIQQLSTNVDDAKKNGVFKDCEVDDGAQEVKMLEEWTYYLLTLGPSVVLSLSCSADQSTAPAFARAKDYGWTNWTPPGQGSSRSTFLKEALTRVYNDRLSKMGSRSTTPESNVASERSNSPGRSPSVRDRQQALAEELRQQPRKAIEENTDSTKKLTKSASFDQERPMSGFPNILSQLALRQSHSIQDLELPIPVAMEFPAAQYHSQGPPDSAYASTAQRMQHQNGMAPRWHVKPQKPNYSGTSYEMQRYEIPEEPEPDADVVDPVDFALWTLTSEHGFSREEAVWALRKFETGESVNVDKAVALLLRQRELGHPTTKRLEAWTGTDDRTPTTANSSAVWSRPRDFDTAQGMTPKPDGINNRDTVIISPVVGSQTCCPHCSAARIDASMSGAIATPDARPTFTMNTATGTKMAGRRSTTNVAKEDGQVFHSPRRHLRSVRDVSIPLYRTYTYVKDAGKGIRQVRFSGSPGGRSGSFAVGKKGSLHNVSSNPAAAAVAVASPRSRLADLKRLSVDLHQSVIFPTRPELGNSMCEEDFENESEGRQGSLNQSFIGSDGGSDKETVATSSSFSGVEKELLQQRRGESPVSSLDSMVEEKQKIEYLQDVPKTPVGFVSVPYHLPAVFR